LLKSYGEEIEKRALIWVLSTFGHDRESRPAIQGLVRFGEKERYYHYGHNEEIRFEALSC
jgi:hypothetical protein